jgi:hypothetical protein
MVSLVWPAAVAMPGVPFLPNRLGTSNSNSSLGLTSTCALGAQLQLPLFTKPHGGFKLNFDFEGLTSTYALGFLPIFGGWGP